MQILDEAASLTRWGLSHALPRVGIQAGARRGDLQARLIMSTAGDGGAPEDAELPLDLFDIHYREITIHGAFGRGRSFRRALALMPKLGVNTLVTARFPLARIEDAFAHATAGRGVKTIITPGAE